MTTKLTTIPRTIISSIYTLTLYFITLLFSFLPLPLQKRLIFYLDLCLSLIYISLGRFLPIQPIPLNVDMTGKVAIVTGANSGIGLQIASDLARQHCTVYLACRSRNKAEQALNTIIWRIPSAKSHVRILEIDTSSLESVRGCALRWSAMPEAEDKGIDILVHNAGIPEPPRGEELTEDGLDTIYATNFLGGFLLTHFLEPYMREGARVVLTSSTGQYAGSFSEDFSLGPVRGVCEGGFHVPEVRIGGGTKIARVTAPGRYANSKLMQVCFAKLLQERFDYVAEKRGDVGERKVAHAFAPGFVYTPIFMKWNTDGWARSFFSAFLRVLSVFSIDVEQGATTGSWLAMTSQHKVMGKGNGGAYWDRERRMSSMAEVMSRKNLDRLWVRWENDAGIVWS